MHNALSPSAFADWLSSWGYLGLFICIFGGNLGLPLPEETVLLAAGFLAGQNRMDLKTLYAVGIASAVTGDSAGFLFGRLGGRRLLERLARKYHYVRRRYERLQAFFRTHGNKAVFLARFVAGARIMAGPMAGATGMTFWRFLGWNLLGACIWCPLLITVGYLLGNQLDWVARAMRQTGYWLAAAAVFGLAIMWLFWWRKRPYVHSSS